MGWCATVAPGARAASQAGQANIGRDRRERGGLLEQVTAFPTVQARPGRTTRSLAADANTAGQVPVDHQLGDRHCRGRQTIDRAEAYNGGGDYPPSAVGPGARACWVTRPAEQRVCWVVAVALLGTR